MTQKSFYVDSCIWLNLFKKEGDPSKGVPFWKIAEDFANKIMFLEDEEIIYTGLILREIQFKIGDETLFKEKNEFLKEEPKFRFIEVTEEDYSAARKLESDSGFEISFYDCIHTAICKRLDFVLVTRDNKLIDFAKEYITVKKPEELLP